MADSLIIGGGIHPFGRYKDGSTMREWSREAATTALAEAGIEAFDVDMAIVSVESEHLSLQLAPAALIADEIGLLGIPVVRAECGGGSGGMAVRLAHAHIRASMARCVLVVGAEQAASHLDTEATAFLYGLSLDADREGFAGVTPANAYALSMRAHMARYGTTERELAAVSIKNHGNAVGNPVAHLPLSLTPDDVLTSPPLSSPYKRLDSSPLSDGAAAAVIAANDWAPQRPGARVRIAGTGCANDFVRLGDRPEPDRFAAKTRAAGAACHQAGLTDPSRDIDVVEVYDAFSGAEIQSLEAIGLGRAGEVAAPLCDGYYDADGALPVNLSGGLIGQGGVPGAIGVAQVVTLAWLLTGRYWRRPTGGRLPRRALADCHGGVATTCLVHVLIREGE